MRTQRLRLEPVHPENAQRLWQMLQEPDMRVFQDLPNVDLPQFRRMVAGRPQQLVPGVLGRFEWLIFSDGELKPAGWVSMRINERDPQCGEIGYSVLSSRRGRGIATEAVRTMIAAGFADAQLRRVRAYCVAENGASRAVLANLGFEDDGILPHGATIGGRPVDVMGYVLEAPRNGIDR